MMRSAGMMTPQFPSQSFIAVPNECKLFTTTTQNGTKSWNIDFLTHAEVAKRFEEFDRDGNGFITVAECRAALDRLEREISDGVVRESMWSWDHNNDGVVDYFEFMDFFLNVTPETHADCTHATSVQFDSIDALLQHCVVKPEATIANSLSRQAKVELINTFKHLDLDSDGFLSPDELRVALKSMSPSTPAREIERTVETMIAEGDKNGDGLIDLYEFSTRAVQQGLYS
jgi:Ca2+-binding EF-hand superfamily protein